jgi:hypothetical protein
MAAPAPAPVVPPYDMRAAERTHIRNHTFRCAIEYSESAVKRIPAFVVPHPGYGKDGGDAYAVHRIRMHESVREWRFTGAPNYMKRNRVIAFCVQCGNIVKCADVWFNEMAERISVSSGFDTMMHGDESDDEDKPATAPAKSSSPAKASAPAPATVPTPFSSIFRAQPVLLSQFAPALAPAPAPAVEEDTASNPEPESITSDQVRIMSFTRVRCRCEHRATSAYIEDEIWGFDNPTDAMTHCLGMAYTMDRELKGIWAVIPH